MRFNSKFRYGTVAAGLITSALLATPLAAHAEDHHDNTVANAVATAQGSMLELAMQPATPMNPATDLTKPVITNIDANALSAAKAPLVTAQSLSTYSLDAAEPVAPLPPAPTISFSSIPHPLDSSALAHDEQTTLALLSLSPAPSTGSKSLTIDVKNQLPTMDMTDMVAADVKQVDGITTDEIYGFSYIGGALNIGLGNGSTGLGQTSFAIISKLGLTDYLSFRPAILFTDNLTILLPVTYDFRGRKVAGSRVLPFLGAGVGISTRNATNFELLITGGVDVPLSKEFTATVSLNTTITGRSAIGLLLGLAYNFE